MRLLIPWIPFLILTGCNNDRIARLEKQVQEIQDQVTKQTVIELQSKCSNDGQAFVNREFTARGESLLLTHNAHYNKSSNKCYIVVENHVKQAGKTRSWYSHMALYDVYENVAHGKLSILHDIREPDMNDTQSVVACEVAGNKCASLDEFTKQTQSYMTN